MKLTEQERLELRLRLMAKMSEFIEHEISDDHNIGWIPDNIEQLMADAAFGVIDAINSTNHFIESERLFA